MKTIANTFICWRPFRYLFFPFLLGICFLYVWLRIDPRLVYHQQSPIFMTDWEFFEGYLCYPGGLSEYVAAFLSQLLFWSWTGALVMAALAGLVCLVTRALIARMTGGDGSIVCLIPVAVLLILHNRYHHPLTTDVGLVVALLFVVLYTYLRGRQPSQRFVAFLVLGIAVYYIAGGPFMLFAMLCAAFELLKTAPPSLCIAELVSIVAVPCLGGCVLGGLNGLDAFLRLLPFHPAVDPSMASITLYLVYPLLIVFILMRSHSRPTADALVPAGGNETGAKAILESLFVFVLAVAMVFLTFDRNKKAELQVDYFARQGMWPEVLSAARRLPASLFGVTTHWDVNRALFHTGQLPERMFAYPQDPTRIMADNSETTVLRLQQPARLKLSELFLELGRAAESEHLTQEVLEHLGEQPSIVRQLGLIYVVKREPNTARVFYNALQRHFWWSDWTAERLQRLAEDPFMADDEKVERIRSVMILKDYLGHFTVEQMLLQLLERNPHNRMAFEYLMGHYLLTRQLESFVSQLRRLGDFDYQGIPRHYEEAILMYKRLPLAQSVDLHGRRISHETQARYEAFLEQHARLETDRQDARKTLLASFGDSYFYYHMFGSTGHGQTAPPVSPQAGVGG